MVAEGRSSDFVKRKPSYEASSPFGESVTRLKVLT